MRDTLFFTKLRVFLGQWRRRAHRRTSWMKAQLRHLRRRARGLVRVSRGSSSQSSALNPQHSYASRYALEPLENRILLAADLTGVLVGATGLNPAVPGNTASAVVRVQNIGDNGLTNSELGVYASLDRTLDVSDLLLGTAKTGQMGTKQPIPIFEDTSKKDVRVNLELPSTLDRTFYYLLTKVDNTNTITENSETNNVSFSFFRDLNVVWQFGTVPGRTGNTTLTLRETDGTVVTFRLTGPGLGEVIKDGTNWDLNVTGTTASSAVTITTNSAGNGRVTLNDIHVVGPVGTFLAATTDLTGTLAIDGPVNIPGALPGTVTLRSVQGGTVAVPSVEALTILGPTTNAKFYIGAMLGQDGQPGGTGATADMYGQGKIGLFTVTGAMTNTTVRVGVDPVDGAYGNGNDTIVGGTNSSIGGITIGGSLSADTRFYAGKFPTQYFHGLTRKLTAGDPHFSTNPNGGSPANQPPMNTVPSVQTGNEDTALSIHGLSVTDVDGNLATTQLAVTNGTLTVDLAGGATISAGANGTNMLTVSGTQAQINAALATLRYRGTSNYNGPDTLIVTSTDSASAADVDTVAITVQPVNDAPSFVKGADQTAQEDAGLQTVVGWATNISAGPVNENGQSLTFDVTNDNTSLFSNQPAVAQDGTLTFTPAANAFGTALVTVMLRDDGGTANGGSDTSAAQTFSITVNPVADTVTWTGTAGDGLWNTAGNWDIGRIPDANDDVVINVPDTAIELGSGVTSVRNLTVTTELLELTSAAGGTLAVDGLASVRTLEIRQAAFRVGTLQGDALALSRNAQATVTGATDLTTLVQFRGSTATFDGVTEIFSVRVGGLAGTGGSPQLFPGTSDVVQFNGATQIHEALLLFAQGTLIGTGEVVLTGNQLRWLGGTMNGSGRTIVESGRTLEISSTTPVGLDRTLENRGTVLMRAGTEVTGTGNYGQTALGRLQVEIGGPTTFGRLGLSGAVSLAGELEVTLLNGFVPADGTRFQFLTNGTRTGSFATTALPSGLTLDTTDPADLEVVAIATNHVPVANAQSVTTPEDTSKTITLTGSDGDNDPLTFNIVTGPQHGTLTAVTPVPFTGLVSRWSAEGDAGDSIGPSFENGSLQNGAAIVTQGKVGQGFSFDGTNDHILVPAASALNVGLGSGFTISTWINPTDLSQSRPLVEWNKVGAPFEGVHVWIAGAGLGNGPGSLYANIKDSTGGNHIFSSAAGLLTTNMYQQATLTYDKTTGVGRMYLNGEQVTSANLGIFTPSTSSDLYFGLRPANGGAPGTWFSYAGRMDEVGIYNRALSAQDVDQLFKAENSLVGSNGQAATLNYTPEADYNGPDSFTFTVNDGTVDSAPGTVTIDATAVNDAPSFTKGADQTVQEDAGLQTVAGWATNISAGPVNESGQNLTFVVTNDNNALFSVQPAVAPDGTLTFTSASNVSGTATAMVVLRDNGGTSNGGVDTSVAQTFTITVMPITQTVSWINPAGGDWADGANWSTGSVPTATQDVVIDLAVTNPIVFSSGVSTIKSLTSTQPLTVTGGSLTVTEAATVGAVTVTGGTLTLNGATTITRLTMEGGTLAGSGVVTLTGTESRWQGGSLQGSAQVVVQVGAHLEIANTATPSLVWTLRNEGTLTLTTESTTEVLALAGAFLNNFGTLISQGPGTVQVALFNNDSGRVFVQGGGTLTVQGERQLRGRLDVAAGSTLQGRDTELVRMSNTVVTGAGTFRAPGGMSLTGGTTLTLTDIQAVVEREFGLGGPLTLTGASQLTVRALTTLDDTPGNLGVTRDLTLQDTAQLVLAPGVIVEVRGAYQMGAATTLTVQLDGQVGHLDIPTGSVTLAGTLTAELLNGFVPADGARFQFLTHGSPRTGAFATTALPPGLTLDATDLRDLELVVQPITQTVSWINPAGGDWADGANWSTGSVPTATQDVVIDLAGTYTITHSTGTTQIKSLKSEHQINLTGGTLTVTKSVQMNGAVLSLAGGTLKNSTVTGTGVNDRVMEVLGSGTVDGITFENNDSAIHMYVSPGAQLTIVNGMTMNGGGLLVEDGHVVASSPPSGSQTIGGTSGGITLRRGDLTSPGATLILGQNIDILSERGSIGSVDGGIVLMGSTNVTGNGELNTVNVRNMGHIQVNGKAGPADVGGVLAGTGFFFNEGSIGAQNGSLLSFERFENSGAIRILHPGLNPVVTFTMTDTNPVYNLPTGTIEIWNDLTMNLIGSLYNEGRVFTGQEVAPDSRGVLNISGDVTVPNSGAGIWLHDGEMKVEGTLVNLGTVNLETGLLQVGDYVQEQGSSLSTNLASLTDFGRLAVDRVATLNGILAVAPTGALTPGDRYRFMTFGSRGNSFEDLQLPSNLVLDDTDPGFLELVVNA